MTDRALSLDDHLRTFSDLKERAANLRRGL
jgi:hypothetical protein